MNTTTAPLTGEAAIAALAEIHAAMSVPFDWCADTHDNVANVLVPLGFRFPEEAVARDLEDLRWGDGELVAALAEYRPEAAGE